MSNKMKALILNGANDYVIGEQDIPEPKSYEVLCKIKAVAICGSDPGFISGKTAGVWPPHYPFTIGHEWAGVVEKVGADVTQWKPGDRVAGEAHSGCGFCRNCKQGRYNLCLNYNDASTKHRHYGHKDTGAFSEYGAFTAQSLTQLPDNVSFEEGSVIDAAGTAIHVAELTGITPGGTVAVIGPGPIGLITASVAKAMGASRVIMIGRGVRLEVSKKHGADLLIDFEKEDAVKIIEDYTAGMMADEVFECSGGKGTLQQAIEIVKRGGHVGIVGIPAPGTKEEIDNKLVIIKEIKICGGRANPNVSHKLLSMISAGNLSIKEIITHIFSLRDFRKGYETFLDRKTGALKVIINP